MSRKIYTLGYGRTTKERFIERMTALRDRVDGKLVVVDVRKAGCQSINGRWCWMHIDKNGRERLGTIYDTSASSALRKSRSSPTASRTVTAWSWLK